MGTDNSYVFHKVRTETLKQGCFDVTNLTCLRLQCQRLGLMFVLKINADSLENPFYNQLLQCKVTFAKQQAQIPCLLESKNFEFDPYV